jgi:hypothetical protein
MVRIGAGESNYCRISVQLNLKAIQAAVCKAAEAGATPARDSISLPFKRQATGVLTRTVSKLLEAGPIRCNYFMNQRPKEVGIKKLLGTLRLWLMVLLVLFLCLLAVMQFLPGGNRSFSDWWPPLLFLLVVSIVTATILVSVWGFIRRPFSVRRSIRFGCTLIGLTILIALPFAIGAVKYWMAWNPPRFNLPGDSVAETQPAASHLPEVLGTNNVRVNVDASRIVRTVDPRLFGINTAIWDGLLDSEPTVSALRELDLQVLRFPGGGIADSYDWKVGTFGPNSGPAPTSFANFMHLATNLGAQVIITVNYGSGTPEEAADWVRCANITNHCAFKYWEIGNENYGDWERDDNSLPHDPVTYATRAKEFIRQMKAADPSIKVGVVVTENWMERAGVLTTALERCNLREFMVEGYQGWTPKMFATLKQRGVTPDWVSLHYYPPVLPGWENDARLLQFSSDWAGRAASLRKHLKTYFDDASTKVEMFCTENNSAGLNPGKQMASLVNGLYLADSFGQIAQTEFNSFLWWDLRNSQDRNGNNSSSLYGWRPYGDYGIMSGNDTRYPTFYVAKLLKYFARAGDRIVPAASDNQLASVYAARHVDETLALLVINKSPQIVMNVNFSVVGFQPQSVATIFSYGMPQDEAARTGSESCDIAQTNLTGAGTDFSSSFAPYSVTVIVLSPSKSK